MVINQMKIEKQILQEDCTIGSRMTTTVDMKKIKTGCNSIERRKENRKLKLTKNDKAVKRLKGKKHSHSNDRHKPGHRYHISVDNF
jgi:3,4-dihydroxy-2-butanone 4-phosphate synthase